MTITHPLGADGLAILALTARSVGGRSGGPGPGIPKPLPPKDWARVARALAAAGASPADLLGRDAVDLGRLLGGATAAAEVIAQLAGRATTLALEVERLAGRGIWLVSTRSNGPIWSPRRRACVTPSADRCEPWPRSTPFLVRA